MPGEQELLPQPRNLSHRETPGEPEGCTVAKVAEGTEIGQMMDELPVLDDAVDRVRAAFNGEVVDRAPCPKCGSPTFVAQDHESGAPILCLECDPQASPRSSGRR